MYLSLMFVSEIEENAGMQDEQIRQILLKQITPSVCETLALENVEVFCKSVKQGKPVSGFKFALNKKQAQEVEKALKQNFTIIQGPPGFKLIKYLFSITLIVTYLLIFLGTGKSYMGAQLAVLYAMLNRKSCKSESPNKVLYCGPSNKSVNVVSGLHVQYVTISLKITYIFQLIWVG